MGEISIKKVEYRGWTDCFRISNGVIDVVATTAVGPRIIRFGFVGGENEFCEVADQAGTTDGKDWKIYGGHRLWHSPEHSLRTYESDNGPIQCEIIENGIKLSQPMEPWTQVVKEIELTVSPDKNRVDVLHRIINHGAWEIELAIWAISVMAPEGREVIPQPVKDTGPLPNRMISLWPYTKMNDSRVQWGEKYVFLDQDTDAAGPFKFGIPNEDGWAAYFNRGRLFIKKFNFYDEAVYPDFGSSTYETYTNNFMTEMESLSPLALIENGESIEHTESWFLFDDIGRPESEKEAGAVLKPILKNIFK